LLLKKNLDAENKNNLAIIDKSARRISEIINSLNEFSLRSKPVFQYIDVNDIILKVIELRSTQMSDLNISASTDFQKELPLIPANKAQLQHVFNNLMSNAEIEAYSAHGQGNLIIKTYSDDTKIYISFSDDGPGILPENMELIFKPFFTTRKHGKGTGLGLSISQVIIAEHQGDIRVESKPGEGATFIIELPLIKQL
jgi:C4-dicarboxylate-specific signal transduction histidine kinase